MSPMCSCHIFTEPKIISQPSFEAPFNITKDLNRFTTVNLIGCCIASHFNLSQTEVYWLKNGYEKLHLIISDVISKGGSVVKLTNNNFKVNEKYRI